jgi:hypothetical protein
MNKSVWVNLFWGEDKSRNWCSLAPVPLSNAFTGDRAEIGYRFEASYRVATEVIEKNRLKEIARPEGSEPPNLCLKGAE